MAAKPHDRLGRAVFSRPDCAAAQLRAFLPPAVLDLVDLSTLEVLPGTFVDEALGERQTDLLYRVRLGARDALLYLLFEHQSTPDPRMPLRMLRYLVRIWDRWLEEHPRSPSLPAIVPVVLYHGARPWSAPVELRALIDVSPAELEALAPHLPALAFELVDLTCYSDADLRRVASGGTALAGLALLLMKHAGAPDLSARLARWADLVRGVRGEPGSGLRALEMLVRYILATHDRIRPDELAAVLGAATDPDVVKMTLSTADRLRAEGRSEGRSEGRAEGRTEALREALLRLLDTRFGAIPKAQLARVEGAAFPTLKTWFDRALTGTSLDEVFAA